MKQIFEIKDKKIIDEILVKAEYGTLALCKENKPYSLPVNFVQLDEYIYFHGSLKGRKVEILKDNPFVSFSVVKSYSMIQSYFSSNEGLACPATHFFKSVMIEGEVFFVNDYDEKVKVLEALMQKLQSEGRYKPLEDKAYEKTINATNVFKLIPAEIRAKFKFGQHLNEERFDMIIKHLEQRGDEIDQKTVEMMKSFRKI